MHTTSGNSSRDPDSEVASSDRRELSPLRALTALLRQRRLIAGMALFLPLVVGSLLLVSPRAYTAKTSFIPFVKNTQNSLQGLAAQFGVDVPGGDPTQSVFFYADLLRSADLLGTLVETKFTAPKDGTTQTLPLWDFLDVKAKTPELRHARAIVALKAQFSASTSQESGIITVGCTMSSPELARATAERALSLINEFNVIRRRSQAAAEREFAERRVSELRAEVAAINDRWLQFLRTNRGFSGNFEQSFENEKFAREAEVQKGVLALMLNSYEQAKMDEVRNTPLITIVDRPSLPVVPDPRGVVLKTLFALVAGILIGALIALWKEFATIIRPDGASREYAEYRMARETAMEDLRRLRIRRRE